jgi:thioredoxin-like negative regulator of GroEL
MSQYATVRESYKKDEDTGSKIVFDIDSEESFHDILQKFPIVVVDAHAKWCAPCRQLGPKYNQLAHKYEEAFNQGQVIFLKDDIDQNEDIHKPFISVVPTFFIYVQGQRNTVEKFSDIDAILQDLLNRR